MPRTGRFRRFIKEYNESQKTDKISFIPPFFILILEIILITHAIIENNVFVIWLTLILVIISIIEIIFVAREIHEHYQSNNFDRELTIRLDDFIIEKNEKNVQTIVEKFIDVHPNYEIYRNEIYHIACQIMETHKKELWEKTLELRLKKYVLKNSNYSMKEIMDNFMEKFPEYKKDPGRVYPLAAQMIEKYSKN
ncbi:MAG: hypothetical protein LN408_01265 [Candidatus Thermoplasmatota archaeon]|nr:hypothetical protein [Candidatus Thermoplasmatota archaeon]MCK5300429.1 hypothetical protein [Thermoplasmatales archaeon]